RKQGLQRWLRSFFVLLDSGGGGRGWTSGYRKWRRSQYFQMRKLLEPFDRAKKLAAEQTPVEWTGRSSRYI
ncbi:MAG TPA: hypothetical protein DDZ66_09390, partial [Firmicutes bacterium]|nr:hypothetical protein [Bacillota bacterium]